MLDGYKIFKDAVHGAIELPLLCVKIVDTPQFQRLRFVKQTGVCDYVYHSATHSRFEHSIGVCHLAGQLVKAIRERQPELHITDSDVLCVQIAGLCHDLGHGVFSHLFENFMAISRPERKWKHEQCSVDMLSHLLTENNLMAELGDYGLCATDLIFIQEMILGPPSTHDEEWQYKGRLEEKAFLYQIVSNKRSGVDVDKWDYFLRDGHNLGVKVTFDHSRLIAFCRVIDVPSYGKEICFREKEVDNLYDMFHARRTLHRTAYQHRVVKIIDSMILDALVAAEKHITFPAKNGSSLTLSEAVDDMHAFTHVTDDILQQIYRSTSSHPDMVKARNIVHNLHTRKLYTYVGQTMPTTQAVQLSSFLSSIVKALPLVCDLSQEDFDVHEILFNYGMGSRNPMEAVRFYSKKDPDISKVLRQEEVSTMLPQKFEERLLRVMCKRFDTAFIEEAKEAFVTACAELGLGTPSKQDWHSHLTPMEPSYNLDRSCTERKSNPSIGDLEPSTSTKHDAVRNLNGFLGVDGEKNSHNE